MNSRERWLATLQRKPVDKVPCDIGATEEVFQMLCSEFNCDTMWVALDKLGIDRPYRLVPPYVGRPLEPEYDFWQVKYQNVSYGTGSYKEAIEGPLEDISTISEMESHDWPDPDDFDYSNLKRERDEFSHRPIRAGYVEPLYIYAKMRGLEQAMMDLVESPDLVECAFDHIFDFATRQFQRILETVDGRVDITVPSEDLGSQTGPLFSKPIFERFHKPRFKKYIDLAHQAGAYVFFHTDGACRDFIPGLIELGVDILNPIQWMCPGMERNSLKTDFGERLVFHGGVENQKILPFGTSMDVRKEVINCFEMLGTGGGYICAPCHNIQPNTPIKNILTMYETINEIRSDPKYTTPVVEATHTVHCGLSMNNNPLPE